MGITVGEVRFMEVVQSHLRKIAQELERANRLEAFRLRKEHSSAEDAPAIDAIMGGHEP